MQAFVLAKNKEMSDLSDVSFGNNKSKKGLSHFKHLLTLGRSHEEEADDSHGNARANAKERSFDNGDVDDAHPNAFEWQKLLRRHADAKASASNFEEAMQHAEDQNLRDNYFLRAKPLDLADAIIKTSVVDEVPHIDGHLIIMGKSLNNLYDLIRPLRARYLGSLRYIVILFPDDIPHAVWQRISIFEDILVVRGSSLEEADIRRAGIFKAQQVIVLAAGAGAIDAAQTSSGMQSLVDSDAIFSFQCVKRMNDQAEVHSNVLFTNTCPQLDFLRSLWKLCAIRTSSIWIQQISMSAEKTINSHRYGFMYAVTA